MCVAVDDLLNVLDNYGDQFNWAYSHFVQNGRSWGGPYLGPNNKNEGDLNPPFWVDCDDGYCGGLLNDLINPPSCGEFSDISAIEDRILNLSPFNQGLTPLGLSLEQITQHINTVAPESSLYPGQKNYVLLLTDGWDTCECSNELDDGSSSGDLRGNQLTSAFTTTVTTPLAAASGACDNGRGYDAIQEARIRAYNVGLKAEDAFKRLQGDTPPYDGSTGDIFVVGMGVQTDSCFTSASYFEEVMNHMAWKASGIDLGRADAHGAYFAKSKDDLSLILDDILGNLGIPTTEVTLGAPIGRYPGFGRQRHPGAGPPSEVPQQRSVHDFR
jgi:hypothetical protein